MTDVLVAVIEIVAALVLLCLACAGLWLAVYLTGSFINRIGNPYDKW
jgi:hypothetical protein